MVGSIYNEYIPCTYASYSSPASSYCDKIKETMDYVVKLMSIMQVSQEEEEQEQDDQQQPQKHKQEQKLKPNLPADINVHIMNLNGLLNQLNQFLELQQQEQEKLQA